MGLFLMAGPCRLTYDAGTLAEQLLLMAEICKLTHDAGFLPEQFPRDLRSVQSRFCVFGTHQGIKNNNKWEIRY